MCCTLFQVLNGGDKIGPVEREDAERAFIRCCSTQRSPSQIIICRHFLDTPEDERPLRFEELVAVHGLLDPLVNVDLTPEKVCQHIVDRIKLQSYYPFKHFKIPHQQNQ